MHGLLTHVVWSFGVLFASEVAFGSIGSRAFCVGLFRSIAIRSDDAWLTAGADRPISRWNQGLSMDFPKGFDVDPTSHGRTDALRPSLLRISKLFFAALTMAMAQVRPPKHSATVPGHGGPDPRGGGGAGARALAAAGDACGARAGALRPGSALRR